MIESFMLGVSITVVIILIISFSSLIKEYKELRDNVYTKDEIKQTMLKYDEVYCRENAYAIWENDDIIKYDNSKNLATNYMILLELTNIMLKELYKGKK